VGGGQIIIPAHVGRGGGDTRGIFYKAKVCLVGGGGYMEQINIKTTVNLVGIFNKIAL
jgi:hypothetical protein